MSYNPATLDFGQPFTDWGAAEIDAFPQLVEFVAVTLQSEETGPDGTFPTNPLGLAGLGFEEFIRIALLTVDVAQMPAISTATRAAELLLNDARRTARRTPA